MPMITCVFSPVQFTMVRKHNLTALVNVHVINPYVETLFETEVVNIDTTIIMFSATDADQPGTNNSRVIYYVDQRDDNQLFVLNSATV